MISQLQRASAVLAVSMIWMLGGGVAQAAEPDAGVVSEGESSFTFTAGPFFLSDAGLTCAQGERVAMTTQVPASTTNARLRVSITMQADDDVDLFVDDAPSDQNAANPEIVEISVAAGESEHVVELCPFMVSGQTVSGLVELLIGDSSGNAGNGTGASSSVGVSASEFSVELHALPGASEFGEPTLGVNLATENVMYVSGLQILRVQFDDSTSPATVTAEDVSYNNAITSLDPILFVDPDTGRTFASQLTGANSIFAFSDDDGATWTPAQIGPPNGGVDHQGVGGGRYPSGADTFEALAVAAEYVDSDGRGHAVYYCSQSIVSAFCARSDDGGLTFGAGVPIRQAADACGPIGALHGHPQVAPDGTVYVPFKACGSEQMLARSDDAGLTWAVKKIVNDSAAPSAGSNDPHLGIATDGTLYVAIVDGDGKPWAAVSTDKGESWASISRVGLNESIAHAVFPQATAGDPDRGAVAFIGTTTDGDSEDSGFAGIWYLYIAVTYDQGQNWETIRASADPIQGAGGICTAGTTCGSNRNLLDFNDMVIDEAGRVLVGLADGCVGGCVTDPANNNGFNAKATIARQASGRRMLAAFDLIAPTVPTAPVVKGTRTEDLVSLSWPIPFNGGSDISSYTIYRGLTTNNLSQLATVTEARYVDTAVDSSIDTYFYQVSATNAQGESLRSAELSLQVLVSSDAPHCKLPGVLVSQDASGDHTTGVPGHDALAVYFAEPHSEGGVDRFLISMEIDDLTTQPPETSYEVHYTLASDNPEEVIDRTVTYDTTTGVFSFGHTEPGSGGVNSRVDDGSLGAGSALDLENNRVLWVLDKSLVPGLAEAGLVENVSAQVWQRVGVLISRVDDSPASEYEPQGNPTCAPVAVVTNAKPIAILSAAPLSGVAPLVVRFDASGSTDSDGSISEYQFDFDGDGSADLVSSNPIATHEYLEGNWPARLVVLDSDGALSGNQNNSVVIQVAAAEPSPGPSPLPTAEPTSAPASSPTPSPSPIASQGPTPTPIGAQPRGTSGSGAFSGIGFLILGGLACRRRRAVVAH